VIMLDIPERRPNFQMPDDEIGRRFEDWEPLRRPVKGILDLYAQVATSADEGAIWLLRRNALEGQGVVQ